MFRPDDGLMAGVMVAAPNDCARQDQCEQHYQQAFRYVAKCNILPDGWVKLNIRFLFLALFSIMNVFQTFAAAKVHIIFDICKRKEIF